MKRKLVLQHIILAMEARIAEAKRNKYQGWENRIAESESKKAAAEEELTGIMQEESEVNHKQLCMPSRAFAEMRHLKQQQQAGVLLPRDTKEFD